MLFFVYSFVKHGCYMYLTPIIVGTTILDAVKASVGAETEVIYKKHPSKETVERSEFSYAIVAVGEAPYAEVLGDDPELKIPFSGADIISLVAERIPTLVILISGRPLVLEPSWLLDKIDGLVAAWLPGTEGEGITDVIFGTHDFKGKLPVTWIRRVEQLDQPTDGVNSCEPLFPLDFGLSYNN